MSFIIQKTSHRTTCMIGGLLTALGTATLGFSLHIAVLYAACAVAGTYDFKYLLLVNKMMQDVWFHVSFTVRFTCGEVEFGISFVVIFSAILRLLWLRKKVTEKLIEKKIPSISTSSSKPVEGYTSQPDF